MLFNSYIFILLFLPITLCLHFLTKKDTYRWKYTLIAFSLVFVAYAGLYHLAVLLCSVLMNYCIGKRIANASNDKVKKRWLFVGVILDVLILGAFKYTNFILSSISGKENLSFHILLPLGISFYSFVQIAYLVDTYRGDINHSVSLSDYTLFVSFFPKAIQGPIVRFEDFKEQLTGEGQRRFSFDDIANGLYLFTIGLSKKILLADQFGKIVSYGYSNISGLTVPETLMVIIGYTLQIYFDFSGYSDMALGIARMFHIALPWNFSSPYKALSIDDFWKRWHITLTKFLTRYIYIPLGGNRKGKLRTYINVFLVFLISGIWHGAGYTFLIWGALHGAASIVHRMIKTSYEKLHAVLKWLVTFTFVNIAWVFFRAPTLTSALSLMRQLFVGKMSFTINAELTETMLQPTIISALSRLIPFNIVMLLFFALAIIIVTSLRNSQEMVDAFHPDVKTFMITLVLLTICLLSISGVNSFLYTNF